MSDAPVAVLDWCGCVRHFLKADKFVDGSVVVQYQPSYFVVGWIILNSIAECSCRDATTGANILNVRNSGSSIVTVLIDSVKLLGIGTVAWSSSCLAARRIHEKGHLVVGDELENRAVLNENKLLNAEHHAVLSSLSWETPGIDAREAAPNSGLEVIIDLLFMQRRSVLNLRVVW